MHGWEQFHAMDLIIHNIDMPFFFLLCMYVCMYACMCLYLSLSLFFFTQISKRVSTKFPHGSHALYLRPFGFEYFHSSLITISGRLMNHSICNVTYWTVGLWHRLITPSVGEAPLCTSACGLPQTLSTESWSDGTRFRLGSASTSCPYRRDKYQTIAASPCLGCL